MPPDPAAPDISQRLYAGGWHQGSIFQATGAVYGTNQIDPASGSPRWYPATVKNRDWLVLITQDCDIVAQADREPNVEALVCRIAKPEFCARLQNSARWFLIDPTTRLVAHIQHRVTFAKTAVEAFRPEPWPSDARRRDGFIRWLAHRYDRPALPDEIVEAFQRPVAAAIQEFSDRYPDQFAAFSRAVRELRVSDPTRDLPPYDLNLLLVLATEALTAEEADAIEAVKNTIRAALGDSVELSSIEARIWAELSMAEFVATRPVYLEHYSYQGDDDSQAEPLPRR